MPLGGTLIARIGPRITLLAGGILLGIGWMSAGFTTGLTALVLTYGIVGGLGVGLAYGVPLAVAGSWFPERRGLAMGLTLAGFGVSPFVTAPLAEFLIIRTSVRTAMLTLGIVFIVVVSSLAVFLKARRAEQEPVPEKPVEDGPESQRARGEPRREFTPGRMLRSGEFYGLWLCYVIGTLAGLTAIGMTASFAREAVGLSAGASAAAVSVFGILNGIGRPIFGAVHDRLGTRFTIVLSYVLIAAAAGISLIAAGGAAIPFFFGFGIFWLMLGGWLAIAPAATTRLYGARNYARNYGIMYTAYGVGALVGGGVAGSMYTVFGSHRPLFLVIAGLCVVGVVLAFLLVRPESAKA
jgi:MFS family permease